MLLLCCLLLPEELAAATLKKQGSRHANTGLQELHASAIGILRRWQRTSASRGHRSLAQKFNLTEQERRELLPSGRQEIFENRVGWARTYLKKAGLIEATKRGVHRITQRGLEVLRNKPDRIDVSFLDQFEEFRSFRALRRPKTEEKPGIDSDKSTPEELLESAYQKLRSDLASELLQRIKSCSPRFFERLVVELILKMGYGGSRQDAGKAIGGSGDEGVDGIIKEDKLGLDTIYIQAKRWQRHSGSPRNSEIRWSAHWAACEEGAFHHHIGLLRRSTRLRIQNRHERGLDRWENPGGADDRSQRRCLHRCHLRT